MSEQPGPLYLPPDAIDTSAVRRILVIMLRHHGDVLLTSPLIEVLARQLGHAELDVLLYSDTRALLEHNPRIHRLHLIERSWKHAGAFAQLRGELGLYRRLRARQFDLVIHLSDHRRGATLARLLHPRWSVAPMLRNADATWKRSFTHFYPSGASAGSGNPLLRRHRVEQNLDALRRLGIVIDVTPALSLVPGPEGEREAADFCGQAGIIGPYVVVQPTSRWMFKCWPIEQNATLIKQLLSRGHTVVLSCAPDEREQQMLQAIVARVGGKPPGLKLAHQGATLGRLAALIRDARLFIGIDSAPMHIAAAMGTPTVALFGPSGETNWGPWRGDGLLQFQVVTHDAFACRPCGQDGCGGGKVSECLTKLPVSRVLAAVDDVLASSEPLLGC